MCFLNTGAPLTWLDLTRSPVTIDGALIHLHRCSLWGEQASWRRLQLRPQPAHTGICLKRVRPALRVLVHHVQQVADCCLGGSICPLSKTRAERVNLWFLLGKDVKSGNVTHLRGPTFNVLPLADRFCHHLPVWTSWLQESGKGRLSNSWYLRGDHTGDHITNSHTKKSSYFEINWSYQCSPR